MHALDPHMVWDTAVGGSEERWRKQEDVDELHANVVSCLHLHAPSSPPTPAPTCLHTSAEELVIYNHLERMCSFFCLDKRFYHFTAPTLTHLLFEGLCWKLCGSGERGVGGACQGG